MLNEMKKQKSTKQLKGLALIVTLILLTFCSSPVESETSNSNDSDFDKILADIQMEELSPEEIEGLIFMREEEKLARDVYAVLYDKWNARIFNNISNSEQRHTDAIKMLLDRYGIEDPVNNDETGIFKDQNLQDLYHSLIEQGTNSLSDALVEGATIEEIDIIDLENQVNNVVDNEDIKMVYNNLLRGSRNHLRAFVRNINHQGETYAPQYLTEEKFEEIINSEMEGGGKGKRKGRGRQSK